MATRGRGGVGSRSATNWIEELRRHEPPRDGGQTAAEVRPARGRSRIDGERVSDLLQLLGKARKLGDARADLRSLTAITAANVQEGPKRMIGSLEALDPMQRFAGVQCPALVVHAEQDTIPMEWSRILADTIPSAEFEVIPGAGHFSMIEDSSILRSAVLPWLRSHSSESSANRRVATG